MTTTMLLEPPNSYSCASSPTMVRVTTDPTPITMPGAGEEKVCPELWGMGMVTERRCYEQTSPSAGVHCIHFPSVSCRGASTGCRFLPLSNVILVLSHLGTRRDSTSWAFETILADPEPLDAIEVLIVDAAHVVMIGILETLGKVCSVYSGGRHRQ